MKMEDILYAQEEPIKDTKGNLWSLAI